MRIPTLTGTIDRRILINYRAEKEVIERILPPKFKPKLVKGHALVGICLIRLRHIRPKGIPFKIGISSENAAHRIAVEWTENGETKEGVYIPRRDTSSRLNSLAGGRIFPGAHHLADFCVNESDSMYNIGFNSDDGTHLEILAREAETWNSKSIFESQENASNFFKNGSVGYSPKGVGEAFEGLELKTKNWEVAPLSVSRVSSSFFEDKSKFPEGSISFDNALLMKNIDHEWHSKGSIG